MRDSAWPTALIAAFRRARRLVSRSISISRVTSGLKPLHAMRSSSSTTFAIEAAPASLIDQSRIGEAVAQHDSSGIERGPNHLVHILRAAGEVKQQLGARLDIGAGRIEQDLADLPANPGSAGLDGFDDVPAAVAQPLGKHPELRGLAAAVDAFERNEHPRRFSQMPYRSQ